MDSAHSLDIEHVTRLRRSEAPFAVSCGRISFKGGGSSALVGRNGSGKTTFLEAIFGLRTDYAAKAAVGGRDVLGPRGSARRDLGVCLQRQAFPDGVRVRDVVRFHRSVFGRADEAIAEAFGLGQLAGQQTQKLSGGERQRVNLYFALAHAPDIFVADEPEHGLDDSMRSVLNRILAGRAKAGRVNLLTTHHGDILAEASRVLVMEAGAIVFDGTTDRAMEELLGERVVDVIIAPSDIGKMRAVRENGLKRHLTRSLSDTSFRIFVRGDVEDPEAVMARHDIDARAMSRSVRPADLIAILGGE